MKIALPVENDHMETQICPSFGRAPFFLIFDTETQSASFIDNSAAASQGGAGIKAAQIIIDNKVDALLTPRCGRNAADVFIPAGIKLYKTAAALASENIKAFSSGQLNVLEEFHEGFHGRQ